MSEEARAFLEAVFEFSTHYAHYVKEMDETLHKRAVDYAKTFIYYPYHCLALCL